MVREAGLEPARPKTQVPKTCVSAISPLPQKSATGLLYKSGGIKPKVRGYFVMLPKRLRSPEGIEHHVRWKNLLN